jgi:hypothetical protein
MDLRALRGVGLASHVGLLSFGRRGGAACRLQYQQYN